MAALATMLPLPLRFLLLILPSTRMEEEPRVAFTLIKVAKMKKKRKKLLMIQGS